MTVFMMFAMLQLNACWMTMYVFIGMLTLLLDIYGEHWGLPNCGGAIDGPRHLNNAEGDWSKV